MRKGSTASKKATMSRAFVLCCCWRLLNNWGAIPTLRMK